LFNGSTLSSLKYALKLQILSGSRSALKVLMRSTSKAAELEVNKCDYSICNIQSTLKLSKEY